MMSRGKSMRILFDAGLAVLCAGCAGVTPPAQIVPDKPMLAAADLRELSQAEKTTLAKILTVGFKDPDSAKFQWPPFPKTSTDGPVTYCTMVNSKNSYGGYTGSKVMMISVGVVKGKATTASIIHFEDVGTVGAAPYCRKEGLDIAAAN
jgi:hypothetical protein